MGRTGRKPIVILVSTFLLLIYIPTPTSGNISYTEHHANFNSCSPVKNDNMSLQRVNIFLEFYEEEIDGLGIYSLKNPTGSDQKLTLFFDPSHEPRDCTVYTINNTIETWSGELKESYYKNERWRTHVPYGRYDSSHPVQFFNVSIPANQTKEVIIDWKMRSKVTYTLTYNGIFSFFPIQSNKEKHKDWGSSYLIISNSSWSRPIKNIIIRGRSHSDEFNNMTISGYHQGNESYDPIELKDIPNIQVDKEKVSGHTHFVVTANNWSEKNTIINFDGKHVEKPIKTLNPCFFVMFSPLIILSLVIIWDKWKEYKRKKKTR